MTNVFDVFDVENLKSVDALEWFLKVAGMFASQITNDPPEDWPEDEPFDMALVVTVTAPRLIDQVSLDNYNGDGDPVTLEEYVEIMVQDGMLLDILDLNTIKVKKVLRRYDHGD